MTGDGVREGHGETRATEPDERRETVLPGSGGASRSPAGSGAVRMQRGPHLAMEGSLRDRAPLPADPSLCPPLAPTAVARFDAGCAALRHRGPAARRPRRDPGAPAPPPGLDDGGQPDRHPRPRRRRDRPPPRQPGGGPAAPGGQGDALPGPRLRGRLPGPAARPRPARHGSAPGRLDRQEGRLPAGRSRGRGHRRPGGRGGGPGRGPGGRSSPSRTMAGGHGSRGRAAPRARGARLPAPRARRPPPCLEARRPRRRAGPGARRRGGARRRERGGRAVPRRPPGPWRITCSSPSARRGPRRRPGPGRRPSGSVTPGDLPHAPGEHRDTLHGDAYRGPLGHPCEPSGTRCGACRARRGRRHLAAGRRGRVRAAPRRGRRAAARARCHRRARQP